MRVNQSGSYPRYRAPTGDGEVLCRPDWKDIPELIQAKEDLPEIDSFEIAGAPLASLQSEARRGLLSAALDYTRSYSDVEIETAQTTRVIATGHQPGLVHPGVWLKNFAAPKIAELIDGVAVSLIIDSDLCRSHSVVSPTGTVESPRTEDVPYDLASQRVPYEERTIEDITVWASFGRRATETISSLVANPMLDDWWPEVSSARGENNLGQALSQARHRLELSWGNSTLELPQSKLCGMETFRRFAAHFLLQAEPFLQAYNTALADYRREHRLRNLAQPVPDLHRENEWLETPFWIWSTHAPTRRPLFVRTVQSDLELSDRSAFSTTLPVGSDTLVECLDSLEKRGIKVRTRALLTTMYARLILSDLFIHGIGGAKYDQVTDHICERFFGFRPPSFVTLTGTLRLPIVHPAANAQHQRGLQRDLRKLRYHPEKEISVHEVNASRKAEWKELVALKSKWVNTTKTHANCAERHKAIEAANLSMQEYTATRANRLQDELDTLQKQLKYNRILDSREYSFCLFPRDRIRNFVLDFPTSMA